MSRSILRIPALLLLGLAVAGPALCAQLPESVNATNPAPPAVLKSEDALWLSAQENLRFRQFQEARLKFEQFSLKYRQDPRIKEALFYQALCQWNLGQEFQALTVWNRLVQQEEQEHSRSLALRLTLEQLVLFHERKGGGPEYVKSLEKLRLAFPEDEVTATLHRQAAQKRMAERDYVGALTLYQALGKRLTEADRPNLELARKLAADSADAPASVLKLANASLAKNELDMAISLYETLLKGCPEASAGEAKTKLGWCYQLKKQYAEAEKLYRQVIDKGPEKDEWRGQSRWQLIVLTAGPNNKAKDAIALCATQAKEFAGEFKGEQALFTRAWLYWTQKKWAEAQAAFKDLILAYPETAARPPIQGYLHDCETGLQPTKGKLR